MGEVNREGDIGNSSRIKRGCHRYIGTVPRKHIDGEETSDGGIIATEQLIQLPLSTRGPSNHRHAFYTFTPPRPTLHDNPVNSEAHKYTSQSLESTRPRRSAKARPMDKIRQIRPRLGLFLDHPPHPHMCRTLLSLVDGQDYKSGIQGGGCEVFKDIIARHRLRNVKSTNQLLVEKVFSAGGRGGGGWGFGESKFFCLVQTIG